MGSRADGQRPTSEPKRELPEPRTSWLRVAWRYVRRTLVIALGIALVVIGVVMVVTPGPAIVVIPIGLAMLGVRFEGLRRCARRLRVQLRRRARRANMRPGATTPTENRYPLPGQRAVREGVDSEAT